MPKGLTYLGEGSFNIGITFHCYKGSSSEKLIKQRFENCEIVYRG